MIIVLLAGTAIAVGLTGCQSNDPALRSTRPGAQKYPYDEVKRRSKRLALDFVIHLAGQVDDADRIDGHVFAHQLEDRQVRWPAAAVVRVDAPFGARTRRSVVHFEHRESQIVRFCSALEEGRGSQALTGG